MEDKGEMNISLNSGDGEEITHDKKEELYSEEDINEDDYVSVDEETIKKNCENLDINTINEEDKYDNVDIIDNQEDTNKDKNKTILEKFMQNLIPTDEEVTDDIKEEVNDDNKEEDNKEEVKEEIKEDSKEEVKEEVKEDVKVDSKEENTSNVITNLEDILSPRKEEDKITESNKEEEIISVNKISDNETVDEFYNDVSRLIESKNKGPINKSPNKYTLFDDAVNNE